MELCGVRINCIQYEDLINHQAEPRLVVTVNAEAVVRSQTDQRLKNIINNHTATLDGQIPLWLFKLKYRGHSVEKISGSELIYTLPSMAEKQGKRVFLLGGRSESNIGAVNRLKELYPTLDIEGYSPPYSPYPFPDSANEIMMEKIRRHKPHVLFVGFGMGKQEFWEEDNFEELKKLGVELIIGCGGSFEFASGNIKRAPKIVQRIGLEGVWRLGQEFKWFRIKRLLLSTKIFYYYLFSNH